GRRGGRCAPVGGEGRRRAPPGGGVRGEGGAPRAPPVPGRRLSVPPGHSQGRAERLDGALHRGCARVPVDDRGRGGRERLPYRAASSRPDPGRDREPRSRRGRAAPRRAHRADPPPPRPDRPPPTPPLPPPP